MIKQTLRNETDAWRALLEAAAQRQRNEHRAAMQDTAAAALRRALQPVETTDHLKG